MWVTVHAVSGLAVGEVLGSRLGLSGAAVVAGGLVSHLVLDAVPHWDYFKVSRRWLWGATDVAAAMTVTLLAWRRLPLPPIVLAGAAAAALPDLDSLAEALPSWRMRLFPSHRPGFPHGEAAVLPGLATQAAVVGLSALPLLAR